MYVIRENHIILEYSQCLDLGKCHAVGEKCELTFNYFQRFGTCFNHHLEIDEKLYFAPQDDDMVIETCHDAFQILVWYWPMY